MYIHVINVFELFYVMVVCLVQEDEPNGDRHWIPMSQPLQVPVFQSLFSLLSLIFKILDAAVICTDVIPSAIC